MLKKVIAILGMPGSGKSEVIKYLEEKFRYPKVYFGSVTFDEMKRRGLEATQVNEKIVREDLRKKFGKDYYAQKVVEKIKNLERGDAEVVLVESLYSWTEYLVLKKEFGDRMQTIAVYASPKTRYARLKNRKERSLSADEAQERDYAQIENLEQGGPIAMADYLIINENDLENLYRQIDEIIAEIKIGN